MRSVARTTRSPEVPTPGVDPFRHGIRYLRRTLPNGEVVSEPVPLRPEDLLFPEEGVHPVIKDGHRIDWTYLERTFRRRVAGMAGALVLADMRFDFNIPSVRPLGPDLLVIHGVRKRRDWSTFDVGAEGARPILVGEITSPDSRKHDLGRKRGFYYWAGIPST